VSVDWVLFREPIHVGDLVTFSAAVNYTGRTSMEIGIHVDTVDIQSGTTRHTNSCYFTMVAVDSDGRPVESPPYTRRTPSRSNASRPRAAAAPPVTEIARTHMRTGTGDPETIAQHGIHSRAALCVPIGISRQTRPDSERVASWRVISDTWRTKCGS